MLDKRKRERVYSSLRLFLDACELWGKTFENTDLLEQIQEMEENVHQLDFTGCSNDTIDEIESATINLIENMDQVLKSIGAQGIRYSGQKH